MKCVIVKSWTFLLTFFGLKFITSVDFGRAVTLDYGVCSVKVTWFHCPLVSVSEKAVLWFVTVVS